GPRRCPRKSNRRAGTSGGIGDAAGVAAAAAGTRPMTADAVVIGSGPNGLVAANVLVDAGWDVLVLEAGPSPGGSVRSAELIEPGFVNDVFSSFYPLGAASPHIRGLELERNGLEWVR